MSDDAEFEKIFSDICTLIPSPDDEDLRLFKNEIIGYSKSSGTQIGVIGDGIYCAIVLGIPHHDAITVMHHAERLLHDFSVKPRNSIPAMVGLMHCLDKDNASIPEALNILSVAARTGVVPPSLPADLARLQIAVSLIANFCRLAN